jgi:hypothetical protein
VSQQAYYAANPDIVCRVEGEDALLFDPSTEEVKVLNATGLMLWNLCDGKHSERDLVQALAVEFPKVESHVLEADVASFLSEMVDLDLLESVPGK